MHMDIPPRTATDEHVYLTGRTLDIVFDVDLGELVKGRHVIARGIALGGSSRRRFSENSVVTQAELHYEFVPGATEEWADQDEWWWTLSLMTRIANIAVAISVPSTALAAV
jgi:hypothetical protein